MTRYLKFSVLIGSVILVSGCANRARFETSGGGHAIFAQVEGNHTVDSRVTHATIRGEFGTVTIERDRARVGDGQWVRIPEEVAVQTEIAKGKTVVRAGKVTIASSVRL